MCDECIMLTTLYDCKLQSTNRGTNVASRCMKLPRCAGSGEGRTTWGLCTQPFHAIFARGCFHDLNP
jgi:hypothetical protein